MTDLIFILLTIYLAAQVNLFRENISVAAALKSVRAIAIISMIALSFYLYFRYRRLLKKMEHQKSHLLLIISLCAMIIGMLLPYHKTAHPFISSLHLLLTLSSVLCLFLFQLIYLSELFQRDFLQFTKMSKTLILYILVVCLIIISCGAINGLSEIITLIYLLLFVRMNL